MLYWDKYTIDAFNHLAVDADTLRYSELNPYTALLWLPTWVEIKKQGSCINTHDD